MSSDARLYAGGGLVSSSSGHLAAVSTAASNCGVYYGILQRRLAGGGAGGATDRLLPLVQISMWLGHRERNGEGLLEEILDAERP